MNRSIYDIKVKRQTRWKVRLGDEKWDEEGPKINQSKSGVISFFFGEGVGGEGLNTF